MSFCDVERKGLVPDLGHIRRCGIDPAAMARDCTRLRLRNSVPGDDVRLSRIGNPALRPRAPVDVGAAQASLVRRAGGREAPQTFESAVALLAAASGEARAGRRPPSSGAAAHRADRAQARGRLVRELGRPLRGADRQAARAAATLASARGSEHRRARAGARARLQARARRRPGVGGISADRSQLGRVACGLWSGKFVLHTVRHRETAKRSWRSRLAPTFWIASRPTGARNDDALIARASCDGDYSSGRDGIAARASTRARRRSSGRSWMPRSARWSTVLIR